MHTNGPAAAANSEIALKMLLNARARMSTHQGIIVLLVQAKRTGAGHATGKKHEKNANARTTY